MSQKLSRSSIEGLSPKTQTYTVWDARLTGFGVRVYPSGRKSYVYQCREGRGRAGKVVRKTIGSTTAVPFDTARAVAQAYQAQLVTEGSLRPTLLAPTTTKMDALFDRVIDEHVDRHLKPTTQAEYRRLIALHLRPAFGHLAVPEVTAAQVRAYYTDKRRTWRRQATFAVSVLGKAFSLAEEWGLRSEGSNPCRGWARASPRRNPRVLFTIDERARIMAELDSGHHHTSAVLAIKLLFSTACRAGEICSLRWSYVDFEHACIMWPDSKTGPMIKPLSATTRSLLTSAQRQSDFVCPSPRSPLQPMRRDVLYNCWRRIQRAANVTPRGLHEIRHWCATTVYTAPGVSTSTGMEVIGHQSHEMAKRYTHLRMEQLCEVAEQVLGF